MMLIFSAKCGKWHVLKRERESRGKGKKFLTISDNWQVHF